MTSPMSTQSNCTYGDIAAAISNHQSFLVLSHVRPDGDAIGCSVAMALCLKQLGKQVTVWNEDGLLEKFSFLPCSEIVSKPPGEPEEFDVVIALDTAAHNRLGATCLSRIKKAKLWINMDHHVSNERYGDLVFVDSTAPAAGEILFDFIRSVDFPLTYEMADNLYIAISTDTGSFQYPNTTARTYEIGAELVKAGANVGKLCQQVYESYPLRRIELLRELLNVLKLTHNDRVASFALTQEMVKRTGSIPEDNEGLIDIIRAIRGVIVAAFFEELPEGITRISLRSKDPRANVCKVCAQFGGGGHVLAAGARIPGDINTVQEKVLKAISDEISF